MHDRLDVPFKIKAVSEDGLFSGYGSVFGVIDSYKEVVAPGAFSESLSQRTPALLWQHRSGEPLGVYTDMVEDSIGLKVEGQLALSTTRGAEAYELLKMKAIVWDEASQGMKFDYRDIPAELEGVAAEWREKMVEAAAEATGTSASGSSRNRGLASSICTSWMRRSASLLIITSVQPS